MCCMYRCCIEEWLGFGWGRQMEEMKSGVSTWQDELATLVGLTVAEPGSMRSEPVESLRDQLTGFIKSWGEMLMELGKGCKDIVQQTLVTDDSFVVQRLAKPAANKLSFLNEFLPEDRDPIHAWPVIFFVSLLALSALNLSSEHDRSVQVIKRIRTHPVSASRVQLPDGRYMAYKEDGVGADRARHSLIMPHPFLSSRLAGIPGVRQSLLEEFGVRLVTYDLPGFGESDPFPARNLTTSASDMVHLAAAIGISDKFWVLGYSSGSMHAWAAMRYYPDRIAGAGMVAAVVNPYEPSMTKEEKARTWDKWLAKRKFIYFIARRIPIFLPFIYGRSFLSGKLEHLDKWMSLSLGDKDREVLRDEAYQEFYQRNVEESVRQGSPIPFVEEAVLQVSSWGFSLSELRTQKRCSHGSHVLLSWFMSMYSETHCELSGFQKPIHIWQGMEDGVAPAAMADYISRVIPEAKVHRLEKEGHFSYLMFCEECHRQIFSALFGQPKGPLERVEGTAQEHNNETNIET